MKFARIDIETIGFVNKKDKTHINFGDHIQNIIIKDIYEKIGILESEIVVLNFNEISTYEGETLILPINQAISHNLSTFISPNIIPIIIGVSRDTTAITEEEVNYLRKFAPVGCRDEAVFRYLKKHGVDCYLNGCITVTLEKRQEVPTEEKVFVIEAPEYALKAMPDELKAKAVFLENTCYGTYQEITNGDSLERVVRKRYQLLKNEATLVVTSRMHIAAPCIGMGIPVILVRKSIDYRFSWIDKYIPVYTEKDVDNINWKPSVPTEIEVIRDKLISCVIKRIKKEDASKEAEEISEFYKERNRVSYDLPQFSKNVIDYIERAWSKESKWNYAIWGENDASERLYNYLTENYPNARYTAFYDSYKTIEYHGQVAQHPTKIRPNDNVFIFVTGYTATDAAKELFDTIGKSEDSYFLFGSVVRGY